MRPPRPAQSRKQAAAPQAGVPQAGKPAAAQPPADEKTLNAILAKAVARLDETVELETAALRSRTAVDLNEYNNRKSQSLLELDRALRLLAGTPPNEAMKDALRSLRRKLDANRDALKTHLDAVREVAGIISETIRNADSDGTYSVSFRSKSQAP